VKLIAAESKHGKPFHIQLRPDIWYWTKELTKDLIPEQQRVLHMVEVKSCWGGVYELTIDKLGGNTIDA
jgi:hypothetical protein